MLHSALRTEKALKPWFAHTSTSKMEPKLTDKKQKHIIFSRKSTPKSVEYTDKVRFSIPYDDLNIGQDSELKIVVSIYDKLTNSFLTEPYSVPFSFDDDKNPPVQFTR